MRTVTRRVTAAVGAGLLTTAVSVALGGAVAGADPAEPTAPAEPPVSTAPDAPAATADNVHYSVSVDSPGEVELFYLTSQPPSKAAYNADPYAFMKKESVSLVPGAPWVFDTNLADPQWAILTVSSTTHGGQAAPNPRCDIVVDGQPPVSQSAPYNPRCQLSQW